MDMVMGTTLHPATNICIQGPFLPMNDDDQSQEPSITLISALFGSLCSPRSGDMFRGNGFREGTAATGCCSCWKLVLALVSWNSYPIPTPQQSLRHPDKRTDTRPFLAPDSAGDDPICLWVPHQIAWSSSSTHCLGQKAEAGERITLLCTSSIWGYLCFIAPIRLGGNGLGSRARRLLFISAVDFLTVELNWRNRYLQKVSTFSGNNPSRVFTAASSKLTRIISITMMFVFSSLLNVDA